MNKVRCAIYTRKSSEEGLEQDFNSLDAQREACGAYVLSQASEGWSLLPQFYDDGGISGGTLERPALKQLLADIDAGKIDIVVVYKVDRLTRSLLDFSKLVEAFDKAGISFVSITQSFNTTTSMGRLTLNMLLSFAQFEREVTAERIRDKIAASKARGMWMGGTPPQGYRPQGRSLEIVEEHAALVRSLFERYLGLGAVRLLAEELAEQGIMVPRRVLTSGRSIGGGFFSRGQLYTILKNRSYIGQIDHRGTIHTALFEGIVAREVWDKVQLQLADNVQGQRRTARVATMSPLAGKLFDEAGDAMLATHACKGQVRYRYYVSRSLQTAQASNHGGRIPARELETVVTERLRQLFSDPVVLAAQDWLAIPAERYVQFYERAEALAAPQGREGTTLVRDVVKRVTLTRVGPEIACDTAALAAALNVALSNTPPATLTLTAPARLTRTGRAVRLVDDQGSAPAPSTDRSLIRLLVQARQLWAELSKGEIDIKRLARREGLSPSYITRVVRLAFLSREVVEAILAGRCRAGVDARYLTLTSGVPLEWEEQRKMFLPG
jgi:DNA invertase Pin-like site-specific DNA recombinase